MAQGDTAINEIYKNPYGEFNPDTHVKRLPKFFNALTGQNTYQPSGETGAYGGYFGYDPTEERSLAMYGPGGFEDQRLRQEGLLGNQATTRGLLMDAAMGRGPSVAEMQAIQQGQQAALQARSMAAGARGPSAALMQRQAMMSGTGAMANAAQAGAMARAAEMTQARGLLSGHEGQMQAGASNMTQQNLAMQGLLSSDRQAQLNARTDRQKMRAEAGKGNGGLIGNAVGGVFSGMMGKKLF